MASLPRPRSGSARSNGTDSADKDRGADDWFPGIDFEEQELVELSIVTVPANPEALVDAPGPGEGTAIATPNPTSGEEVTALLGSLQLRAQF